MDATGRHHVKWSKPGSGRQRLNVFTHVEDRPNINAANILKNRLNYGELTNGRGRVKEGCLESENGWCTFYTRMNIEFLNLLKSP
jgi:hypothetical protein